jgi:hypothetical protein
MWATTRSGSPQCWRTSGSACGAGRRSPRQGGWPIDVAARARPAAAHGCSSSPWPSAFTRSSVCEPFLVESFRTPSSVVLLAAPHREIAVRSLKARRTIARKCAPGHDLRGCPQRARAAQGLRWDWPGRRRRWKTCSPSFAPLSVSLGRPSLSPSSWPVDGATPDSTSTSGWYRPGLRGRARGRPHRRRSDEASAVDRATIVAVRLGPEG